MIRLPGISGSTYAVMGLGASGLVAAEALAASGARVRAWDDDAERRSAAEDRGVTLANLVDSGFQGAEALVLSPGIPHLFPRPHPAAAAARENGVPIICDVELLARAKAESRFIGVTGTNGKSTVTALLGHIFTVAGRRCAIGGNLGPAALGLAELDAEGTYILELSSYQLERIESAVFDTAILINISPDHLERHGGIDGYVAAKEGLFGLARDGAIAVIGTDDEHCRAIEDRLMARGDLRVVPISGRGPVPGGVWVEGDSVIDGSGESPRVIADLSRARALPGRHNGQNAAAAAAAALAAGVSAEHIAEGLATYPGLPHRQELVRRIGPVAYVNDSKATNPEAALRAIACYDAVHWIAGGRSKEGGFAAVARAVGDELARVRHAYLIGEAATEIADALGDHVAVTMSETLEAALAAAHRAAQDVAGAEPGTKPVVLLSPACASFDRYRDFAERGEAFRRAVAALAEETP